MIGAQDRVVREFQKHLEQMKPGERLDIQVRKDKAKQSNKSVYFSVEFNHRRSELYRTGE